MYIFLDESGDTGFKFNRGSSKFFIITIIIFKDNIDAEETSLVIKKLRRRLKLPDFVEFKFSKTKNRFREEFFGSLRNKPFSFKALVIDKKRLSQHERDFKKKFYHFAVKTLFELERPSIDEAVIFIDKKASKSFTKTFNTFLRKQLKIEDKVLFKKFKHRNSRSNTLLQLADMISGAIFRKFEKDNPRFYNLINGNEENLYSFPK